MRLLVVSHTPHYRRADGTVVGWGPTVRELDHLSRLVDELVHLAVLYDEPAPASSAPYRSAVRLVPIAPAGGPRLRDKLGVLRRLPAIWRHLQREAPAADLIHVRAPAHIALLAMLWRGAGPWWAASRPWWVKYAGNWRPLAGMDHAGWFVQRLWATRPRGRLAVTVNGTWRTAPHVVPFVNPCLEREELAAARRLAAAKELTAPLRLLYVGALTAPKGAVRAVEVLARLVARHGVDARLDLVGDGPARTTIERRVRDLGAGLDIDLGERVALHGWLPRGEVAARYAAAHCLLLPSAGEGWPKVLSEAMAAGVVPLAGDVSGIAATLRDCGCGRALPPHAVDAFADALADYADEPALWRRESRAACAAAERFTYDAWLGDVRALWRDRLGVDVGLDMGFDMGLEVGVDAAAPEVRR
ncbi:MAG: glycosyltransferase [Acidobacteriota bacterium]